MSVHNKGKSLIIVISAPSGCGKTTLGRRLLASVKNITRSISCTTRKPRGREVDGKDYYFISNNEFARKLENGDFIEHAVVHGHKYGTLHKTINDALKAGKSVLLIIDVQGAGMVRKIISKAPASDLLRRGFVDIFIMPPSLEELRKRLERRSEDNEKEISARIKNAKREMKCANDFKYVVVNDKLDTAFRELKGIVEEELCETES